MRASACEAKISNIYFATWSVTSPPDTFARKRFASTKVISLVSLPLIDNTESPNLRFAFSARLFSFTYDGINVLMNYKQVLSGGWRAPGALSNVQTFGIFGDAWNFMANLKRLETLEIATFNLRSHVVIKVASGKFDFGAIQVASITQKSRPATHKTLQQFLTPLKP